jgi:hypothetical protein
MPTIPAPGVQDFFERVNGLARNGKETIFSVMRYSEADGVPERTLFKVLLGKDAQFTAEVVGGNLAQRLQESKNAELLFSGLFTKVLGNITMRQIMHDAVMDPRAKGLGKFGFRPASGSLYGSNPPIGLHGGKISLYVVSLDSVGIITRDTREDGGVNGVYALKFTDNRRTDSKQREATLVRMLRIKGL